MIETLSIRLTHTYVGPYKYMDKWENIGTFTIRGSRDRELNENEEHDACEPRLTEHFIEVKTEETDSARIEEAIRSHFNSHSCSHDYDCCGCRSYSVSALEQLNAHYWRIQVASSRNF